MIVDECGADAGYLVGTDRCANAAAADRYATLDLVGRDRASERYDEIWIVVILSQAVRAEIDGLVTGPMELPDQFLFQVEPAVI